MLPLKVSLIRYYVTISLSLGMCFDQKILRGEGSRRPKGKDAVGKCAFDWLPLSHGT